MRCGAMFLTRGVRPAGKVVRPLTAKIHPATAGANHLIFGVRPKVQQERQLVAEKYPALPGKLGRDCGLAGLG